MLFILQMCVFILLIFVKTNQVLDMDVNFKSFLPEYIY